MLRGSAKRYFVVNPLSANMLVFIKGIKFENINIFQQIYRFSRFFPEGFEQFGCTHSAVHRESCPLCNTTVTPAVAGFQSTADFKALKKKKRFKPTIGVCPNAEVFISAFK